MIRFFAFALVAAALAGSGAAQTAHPALEAAFDATVVSTYPDGRTAKLWLEPDGSYRGAGRRGGPSSGRWTLKGNRICLKQRRPISAPFSYCAALPAKGATSWTGKAVTGEPVRIQLVPGR